MQSAPATTRPGLAHAPGIRRLALRLAAPHDADDLVQSTWLRALEQAATNVRSPAAWLRRILRNEHHMALRSSRRALAREQAFAAAADEPEDPERSSQRRELASILAELVEGLDDETREIVRERYYEERSSVEIARAHGIPASTVRWRLKIAVDRLRTQLDTRYGGRRSAWAGVLLPVPHALAPATASTVLAMVLAIATVVSGVVAVAALSRAVATEPRPRTATEAVAAAGAPLVRRPVSRATAEARARWSARVDRIRTAHARESTIAEASDAGPFGCRPTACMTTLAADLAELVDGCEDFVDGQAADLRMIAHIVGAPDVGTVVESIALDGPADAPEALTECLTESIVTLELAPVDAPLDEEITIALHAMAGIGIPAPSELPPDELVRLDDGVAAAVLSAHGVAVPEGAVVEVFGAAPDAERPAPAAPQ